MRATAFIPSGRMGTGPSYSLKKESSRAQVISRVEMVCDAATTWKKKFFFYRVCFRTLQEQLVLVVACATVGQRE